MNVHIFLNIKYYRFLMKNLACSNFNNPNMTFITKPVDNF